MSDYHSQPRLFAASLLALLFALCLTGCAGGRNYHDIPGEGPAGVPRFVEIEKPVSVSTMHFPPGQYSLTAEDDAGYYYAAPRRITGTSVGSRGRAGGVYVDKRNPKKMRGYVDWAGQRTHLGNFSRVKHEFHD